ncbi:hypothetical protein T492DRAFT_869704, partial [Pavlovales sp. CCMP2436]
MRSAGSNHSNHSPRGPATFFADDKNAGSACGPADAPPTSRRAAGLAAAPAAGFSSQGSGSNNRETSTRASAVRSSELYTLRVDRRGAGAGQSTGRRYRSERTTAFRQGRTASRKGDAVAGGASLSQRRAWGRARDAVWLPQRLLMAMALSAWVICLLTASLVVAGNWLQSVGEAEAMGVQLGARATNWQFGLSQVWTVAALALGQALLLLKPPLRLLIQKYVRSVIELAAAALFLSSAGAWWLTVRNYRAHMRALRRGAPRFEREQYSIA